MADEPNALMRALEYVSPYYADQARNSWNRLMNVGAGGLLPPEVRERGKNALLLAGELTPGAGVRDFLDASGQFTNSMLSANPAAAVGGLGGMVLGAAGSLPGGKLITKGAGAPIRAYHGSPHDFDKFDMSKIGTGEGAQAYGHGLYFAGNEDVAKEYRRLGDGFKVDGSNYQGGLQTSEAIYGMKGLTREAKDQAAWHINRGYTLDDALAHMDKQSPKDAASLRRAIEGGRLGPAQFGKTYEVDIHADPGKMLDWDKTLPPKAPIRTRIEELGRAGAQSGDPAWRNIGKDAYLSSGKPEMTGEGAYKSLLNATEAARDYLRPQLGDVAYTAKSSELARRDLAKQGIPGIKYLDGGSRGAGAGTSNYVIFDDNAIEIIRKYGLIPVAVAGGGYMALTPEQAQARGVTQ